MKEILFRGKNKETKEWVYGYYAKVKDYLNDKEFHVIFPLGSAGSIEVIPETVGRLIEYPNYDAFYENERMFEGDIVEVCNRHDDVECKQPKTVAIVVNESCITEDGKGRWFPQDTTRIKVVGNVHDNPELVGKKYADSYLRYNGYGKED